MPDPARLVKWSIKIAERAGMTTEEAADAVYRVASTIYDVAHPPGFSDCNEGISLAGWASRVLGEAAARAIKAGVL